jgi:hypothetical protein
LFNNGIVRSEQIIAARVPTETKSRLRLLAERQQISESEFLRRVLDLAVLGAVLTPTTADDRTPARARVMRLYVRLRLEDRQLLKERARSRGMAAATYASVLIRSHLRNLAPLPKEELLALKRCVAELSAMGRNLNQLTRTFNQGGRTVIPGGEDLRMILKVCGGLRDFVKTLLAANLRSWDQGNADPRA